VVTGTLTEELIDEQWRPVDARRDWFAAVVYIAAPKPLRAETAACRHRVVDLAPAALGARHRPPGSPSRCSWPEPSPTRDSGRGLPRPPEHSSG
jgi:hypothetical protein